MRLRGPRAELAPGDGAFPAALARVPDPPRRLYVVGDPGALQEGLAVVGARRATPYGTGCARRFAGAAARRGAVVHIWLWWQSRCRQTPVDGSCRGGRC